MSSMEAKDLLQAKALGCLDPEDDTVITNLMKEDENFPWQELGHFQNLVAFLPTLLNIEFPEPEVKDNIARKLYELGEKNKAEEIVEEVAEEVVDEKVDEKVDGEVGETIEQEIQAEDKLLDKIEEDGITIEEEKVMPEKASIEDPFETDGLDPNKGISFKEHGVLQMSIDEPDDVKIKPEEKQIEKPVSNTIKKPLRKEPEQKNVRSYISKIPNNTHIPEKSKNKTGLVISVILFVITLLALVFVYLTLSSEIKDNKNEIDKLKHMISSEFILDSTVNSITFKV